MGLELCQLCYRQSIRQQLQRYVVSGAGFGGWTWYDHKSAVRRFGSGRTTGGKHIPRLWTLRNLHIGQQLSETIEPNSRNERYSVQRLVPCLVADRRGLGSTSHIHTQRRLRQHVRGPIRRRRYPVQIPFESRE